MELATNVFLFVLITTLEQRILVTLLHEFPGQMMMLVESEIARILHTKT